MLSSMRAYATSWVVKVLFGLLIVSFAVWGIGDMLQAPAAGGGALAEVAGAEVGQREVLREFQARYEQLQERAGGDLTRQQAAAFGLVNQALEVAVARRLVDAHARDLDLAVAEPELAAAVRDDPRFRGPQGFDRERFDYYLRQLGQTEAAYVDSVRQDLIRSRIVESMTAPMAAPTVLADRLLAHQGEQRRGRALIVASDEVAVEAPDEGALKAYLETNAKRYESPEYRSVALVVLGPDDLTAEVALEEADLRAAYEERLEQYRTPETRRIEQLLAPDEATVQDAAARVAAGESFAVVAGALQGRGVERTELGPLRRGDLPDALDAAAFSLAPGAVSQPVESAFGRHLLRVTETTPEVLRPFEEVRAELETEVRRQRAAEQLPAFAQRLDDEVAAGATLEAAAEKSGVEVLKLPAVDRLGQNEKKEAVAADKLTPDILAAVFAARQGEGSLLTETPDGRFFMFRVDAIQPARPRTLEEVRAVVADEWREERQAELAKARAEDLRKRITDAASFEAVAAAEKGVTRREVGPIRRDDQGYLAALGPEAVRVMFETPAGAVAPRVVPALDGSAVLLVDEVIPAAPEATAVARTRDALTDQLKADLLAQYEAALRQRYPVSVDTAALARLLEAQQGQ